MRRADDALRTALVTGACSGIGKALATRLGLLGYDLVLVSNRPAPLFQTQGEIQSACGVRALPIVADLARPDAAQSLYDSVRQAGVTVDILVNNAGIFFFGEIADAPIDRASALLHLHVVTPSLLCTLFGRDLRARRRGHVLLVSSLSAWRDFPGIGYYGASKKYLRGFARSLRSELSVYGVNVTCLAPGATATGLYDPRQVDVSLAQRLRVMMTAEQVADAGLRAMFAGEAECMPGVLTRALASVSVVFPQAGIDLIRRHAPWLPRSAKDR